MKLFIVAKRGENGFCFILQNGNEEADANQLKQRHSLISFLDV